MPCERSQKLAETISFGVFYLRAEHRGRHLVGLVAHHKVPAAIRALQFLLRIFIPRKFVEPRYDEVVFHEPVSATGRLQFVIGEYFKGEMEPPIELVLPLFRQTTRADDETALQVAADDQFSDEKPRHDCLAGTGVICQQKA